MEFTFLAANVPLCKEFRPSKDNSALPEATPYPRVSKLTNYQENVDTISKLFPVLQKHAAAGRCLLKGYLKQDILNESRAGIGDLQRRHEWICLDFDNIQMANIEAALTQCELDTYSYIIQYSASNGLPHKSGASAHVFFALNGELSSEELQDWLLWLNFEYFEDQTVPRDYGATLKTVVDPAVGRASQILYIADPKFYPGVTDPHEQTINPRWELVLKDQQAIPASTIRTMTPPPSVLRSKKRELLNSNRIGLGVNKLTRTQVKPYKNTGEVICTAPIEARVTSEKKARGYVYINLNGGDSFGYFYYPDSPEILHNFKGEPLYYLKDICPTYYAALQRNIKENAAKPDAHGIQILALQDSNNSKLYNVTIDHRYKLVEMSLTGEKGAQRHLREHGKPVPEGNLFEEVSFCFRPDLYDIETEAYGFGLFTEKLSNEKILNTYNPPLIAKLSESDYTKIPSNIEKILTHVLGNNPECVDRFTHWLAYIVQKPRMTGTAWVITGEQGTGKGVLCANICAPLFGASNVSTVSAMNLSGRFTEVTDNKVLVVLDEMHREQGAEGSNTKDKLKRLITESQLQQEKKFEGQVQIRNFANVIITSNEAIPVTVEPGDRRFNIAPRQDVPLKDLYNNCSKTLTNIIEVVIPTEVPTFYHYLLNKKVDEDKVQFVINNSTKARMVEGSTTTTEKFSRAYRHGDYEYFEAGLVETQESPDDLQIWPMDKDNHLTILEEVHSKYFGAFQAGTVNSFILTKQEFEIVAKYYLPQKPRTVASFKTWAANVGLTYTREKCEVTKKLKSGVKFNSK